jgi:ABC-type Fe3+ transport system permease subunit
MARLRREHPGMGTIEASRGMHYHVWSKVLVRCFLRIILLAPVVASVFCILVDRGPSGDLRMTLFPMAVVTLDPFIWTCFRNSIIFAAVNSILALIAGVGLGWIIARRRFWGRTALDGAVAALAVTSPACMALGAIGLLGPPYGWPWPFFEDAGGVRGASLESWRGLSLWAVWFWTTLPGAVGLVMAATASAVTQLEPTWMDAARLSGAGPFRAWRDVTWPLVKPFAARAAALVFSATLLEPGAPLVLGLRRTIAFQIVDSARQPNAFPRISIMAVMAALVVSVGWILICRWGGPINSWNRGQHFHKSIAFHRIPSASSVVAAISASVIGMVVILGWLPVLGLVRLTIADATIEGISVANGVRFIAALRDHLTERPVPTLALNSLVLGLEAALALIVLARLMGTTSRAVSIRADSTWFEQWFSHVSPLIQGVGLLAAAWLLGRGLFSLLSTGGSSQLDAVFEQVSGFIDFDRNSWILMTSSVSLSLIPLILKGRQDPDAFGGQHSNAAFDAARLAGASRNRASTLCFPRHRLGRLGLFTLIATLAATNLSPAILFTSWSEGCTLGPGVLVLVDGSGHSRTQAGSLAVCIIALNLAALGFARLTQALPRTDIAP